MQVRIGIRDVSREVAFESAQTPEQVQTEVVSALDAGTTVLELKDDKGATILVPTSAIAYVEIGAQDKGRVGFGSH